MDVIKSGLTWNKMIPLPALFHLFWVLFLVVVLISNLEAAQPTKTVIVDIIVVAEDQKAPVTNGVLALVWWCFTKQCLSKILRYFSLRTKAYRCMLERHAAKRKSLLFPLKTDGSGSSLIRTGAGIGGSFLPPPYYFCFYSENKSLLLPCACLPESKPIKQWDLLTE